MNNKAFTLVEMIGTIIILAFVGVITMPVISNSIKKSKDNAYNAQINEIKKAAYDWSIENKDFLADSNSTTITLGELKKKGYIQIDVKNPKTNKLLSNTSLITIRYENNKYNFDIETYDLPSTEENVEGAPSIVLNGDYVYYLDKGSDYNEPGFKVSDSSGNVIENDVSIQISKDGREVPSIDSSQLSTYVITYQTVLDNKIGYSKRTVIVRE